MRKTNFLWLLLAGILLSACSSGNRIEEKIEALAFKSDKNDKWGLISTDGKILFEDEFERTPSMVFNGRYFVTNKNGEYEMYAVSEKPEQVGDKAWKSVCDFYEDVTPAVEKGKAITLIDRDGNVVKEMAKLNNKTVVSMRNFNEGLAIYETIDGYYGMVNTKGDVVIDAQFVSLSAATDGKVIGINKKYEAAYKADETEKIKYSVMNTNGKIIAELDGKKYSSLYEFHNGLAIAAEKKDGEERYGIINEKGDWIVKPSSKTKHITQVFNKHFIYYDGEKYGVKTFDGETVIRAKWDFLYFMDEDLLVACDRDKDKDDRYRFINLEGEQVGKENFMNLGIPYFLGSGDYTIVQTDDNEYQFIDKKGEFLKLDKNADIYDISISSAGNYVESDYVDFEAIVNGLNIQTDGIDGLKLNVPAETAVKYVATIDTTTSKNAENYTYTSSLSWSKDFKVATANLTVTFDSYLGERLTRTVQENYYGYTFSHEETTGYKFSTTAKAYAISGAFNTNYGKLNGKGKDLYKAMVKKFKALGKELKSNDNAIIVGTGKDRYGIVIFLNNTVSFGICSGDGNSFDISQYANQGTNSTIESVDYGDNFDEEVAADTLL